MIHTQVAPLEFKSPGVDDFFFPGTFGVGWADKSFWQILIAAVLVLVLFFWMSHDLKVVPTGKRQVFAEYFYNFVRNNIARETIGHEYSRWVPYLFALFTFLLVNNWFGEFFVFMFPTFSRIGYVYGIALVTWFVYIIAGVKSQGIKYFKNSVLPPGVPWYLWWLMIPLEFLSNFITRPLTLALRLFANMFAGHLIIMIFVVGGGFLLTYPHSIGYNLAGGISIIFSFAIFVLELFVGLLQSYVFTVLTAQYIASSVSAEH